MEAPTRRVERREAVSLNYASPELFNIICKYESVYHTLLNEDGIKKHGEGLLKQINALLSRKDVGMKDLLGAWADDNDARECQNSSSTITQTYVGKTTQGNTTHRSLVARRLIAPRLV